MDVLNDSGLKFPETIEADGIDGLCIFGCEPGCNNCADSCQGSCPCGCQASCPTGCGVNCPAGCAASAA
jgi:hypothetical protein